ARIEANGFGFTGTPGTFFCLPGNYELEADGLVAVVKRRNYRGLVIAGRIEQTGRLSYLNGCSTTVLVPPPKLGHPLLNHLHIPPCVHQNEHTHPSLRFGIVLRGSGKAFGREPSGVAEWEQPLTAGAIFLLCAYERHAFSTLKSQHG